MSLNNIKLPIIFFTLFALVTSSWANSINDFILMDDNFLSKNMSSYFSSSPDPKPSQGISISKFIIKDKNEKYWKALIVCKGNCQEIKTCSPNEPLKLVGCKESKDCKRQDLISKSSSEHKDNNWLYSQGEINLNELKLE